MQRTGSLRLSRGCPSEREAKRWCEERLQKRVPTGRTAVERKFYGVRQGTSKRDERRCGEVIQREADEVPPIAVQTGPKQRLQGPISTNKEGLLGATWVDVLPSPPKDHPTTDRRSPGVVGGHPEIAIFKPTRNRLKPAKSSPPGALRGGNLRKLEIAAGTPVVGEGRKKVEWDQGSESAHSGGYRPSSC